MAEEAVLSTVLSQVSKKILEKLEKGKRLSTEDLLLLYLDLMHKEMREIREEIRETNRRIDETNKRIDKVQEVLSARIDKVRESLSVRIDHVQETLLAKIEEVNKRIDELYKLYAELKRP